MRQQHKSQTPITYAYTPARVTRSGKALCTRCQKRATHEGSYYRSHGAPACQYYCTEHATLRDEVLPLRELCAAIDALGEQVTVECLFATLQQAGISCRQDTVQNALWLRYPDRFAWTKAEAVAARRERWDREIGGNRNAG